jgi:hypothetical protein
MALTNDPAMIAKIIERFKAMTPEDHVKVLQKMLHPSIIPTPKRWTPRPRRWFYFHIGRRLTDFNFGLRFVWAMRGDLMRRSEDGMLALVGFEFEVVIKDLFCIDNANGRAWIAGPVFRIRSDAHEIARRLAVWR